MSRLLRANFSRLFKSKFFYAGILFMAGLGAFGAISRFIEINEHRERIVLLMGADYVNGDALLFTGGLILPIICGAVIGLFIGTEHSDGGLRNKITVGCTRGAIYFSNLIVSAFASVATFLSYSFIVLLLKTILLEKSNIPTGELIILFLCGSLFSAALSSLFVLLSMLIPNKAAGAVLLIVLAVALCLLVLFVKGRLDEPEFVTGYTYSTNGETQMTIMEKNPRYLEGAAREAFLAFYNVLPSCQLLEVDGHTVSDRLGIMSVCALCETVAFTAAGVLIFRKKDVR